MPRKTDKLDESHFYEQIVVAMRKTAPQERFKIAEAWCANFEQPTALANALNIPPIALLTAAMIDIEHPLVSCQRPNISLTSCAVDILTAELHNLPVAIPICTHPLVDNLCTPVDKCLFVHRENANQEVVHKKG